MLQIAGKVLWSYFKSFGAGIIITVLVACAFQLASDLGGNIWLAEWSQDEERITINESVDPNLANIRVGVYGGIGAAQGNILQMQYKYVNFTSIFKTNNTS